jgi:hypothetical protein
MFTYKISWKPMAGFSKKELELYCDAPWSGDRMIVTKTKMTAAEQLRTHLKDGHRAVIEKDNGDSWVLSDSDLHKTFVVSLVK